MRLPGTLLRLGSGLAAIALLAIAPGCSRTHGPRLARPDGGPITGYLTSQGVRLSYRYDVPSRGVAPFPAVVIGHGSGETRKEACRSMGDRLLDRGYAVLCYDKRGVGDSTGVYASVGPVDSHERIPDLAWDMVAGVKFLRSRREVDRNRVGLVGGSQAGWVIPHAARLAEADFMIILVGPTVTVGEEIYYSGFAEGTTTPLARLRDVLDGYTGPRGFDPRPDLEALDVPGLWLLAGADRSIPTDASVRILDELIAQGKPYHRKIYPGAGHGLQGVNVWPDVDQFLSMLGGRLPDRRP
ncbi:MAG: alpha/beta fold hydrolase [Vicinamibacterales bacterium]